MTLVYRVRRGRANGAAGGRRRRGRAATARAV